MYMNFGTKVERKTVALAFVAKHDFHSSALASETPHIRFKFQHNRYTGLVILAKIKN